MVIRKYKKRKEERGWEKDIKSSNKRRKRVSIFSMFSDIVFRPINKHFICIGREIKKKYDIEIHFLLDTYYLNILEIYHINIFSFPQYIENLPIELNNIVKKGKFNAMRININNIANYTDDTSDIISRIINLLLLHGWKFQNDKQLIKNF